MLSRLCAELGSALPSPIVGSSSFSFPSPQSLTQPSSEALLRKLGFGYRAAYVTKTALALSEEPDPHGYLMGLSKLPVAEAREILLRYSGVGPKVADCICLFGLGFNEVVPVDTHVWQIAYRDYGLRLKKKALSDGPLTKDMYGQVKAALQDLWGPYAGW